MIRHGDGANADGASYAAMREGLSKRGRRQLATSLMLIGAQGLVSSGRNFRELGSVVRALLDEAVPGADSRRRLSRGRPAVMARAGR